MEILHKLGSCVGFCGCGIADRDRPNMSDRMKEKFSTHPTWVDAQMALEQVKNKRAEGFLPSLYARSFMQSWMFWLGSFCQRNPWLVIICGITILLGWSSGIRFVHIEVDLDALWVSKNGRLARERQFINHAGDGTPQVAPPPAAGPHPPPTNKTLNGTIKIIPPPVNPPPADKKSFDISNQGGFGIIALIQTPLEGHGKNILNRADMLAHLDMVLDIALMEVEIHGVRWRLDDICFKPPSPDMGGDLGKDIGTLLGRLMSCIVMTPLDCFWEGSKPLGPFPPIKIPKGYVDFLNGVLDEVISWKTLNPQKLEDGLRDLELLDFFPGVADLFDQFGLKTAYQNKSCLDPFDPECPKTAPNYQKEGEIDFGKIMNGGCIGLAENVMVWAEELIIGGTVKENGVLKSAEALQTVMLMASAHDVYKRFKIRKSQNSTKPELNQHIWSESYAFEVLTAWERNFSELIYNKYFNQNPPARHKYYDDNKMFKFHMGRVEQSTNISEDDRSRIQHASLVDTAALLRRTYSVPPMFNPFSGNTLNEMLAEFSKFNFREIIIGYCLMVLYCCSSLVSRKQQGVLSAVALGFMGCFIVTLAEIAGLGFSTLIGIQFNAATTQIVPFLTLGLGVDDMILLACHYVDITQVTQQNELGHLLQETGLTVLLTAISNIVSFSIGTIVPVPALKAFCLQVAILLIFNVLALLTVYPAMMSIDLWRRKSKRIDVLCCLRVGPKKLHITPSSNRLVSTARQGSRNFINKLTWTVEEKPVETDNSPPSYDKAMNGFAITDYSKPDVKQIPGILERFRSHVGGLHYIVNEVYVPFLLKLPVKIVVICIFAIMLILGAIGVSRIDLGLELTDLVPKGTAPYEFLGARNKYFAFYPANTVIRGPFDYPHGQELIHQYRHNLTSIQPYVISHGKLGNTYWLELLRDWLIRLEKKFDEDWKSGKITPKGFECEFYDFKAKDDSVIAYKIKMNHGIEMNRSLVPITRLVNDRGIINEKIFWNALTAWFHIDTMTNYIAQSNFQPPPRPEWKYLKGDCSNLTPFDLQIPPAVPLKMSMLPMFVTECDTTVKIVDMINRVRGLCEEYETKGLPVFPEGIPFTFYEPYVELRHNLLIAVCCTITGVFCVISLLIFSPWTAAICVMIIVMITIEVAGFMGAIGLRLNPISAVTIITAVGVSVEFTVQVCFKYLTSLGSPNGRIATTMEHMFDPVFHGDVATFLGILMLGFSKFDFIVRYFFAVMSFLIFLGIINGLVLLPVILTLIGPKAEIKVVGGHNELPPPSPATLQRHANKFSFGHRNAKVGPAEGTLNSNTEL